jgi:hypothetical protein
MIQSHFGVDRVLSFRIDAMGGAGSHIPDGRRGLLRMKFPWNLQQLE